MPFRCVQKTRSLPRGANAISPKPRWLTRRNGGGASTVAPKRHSRPRQSRQCGLKHHQSGRISDLPTVRATRERHRYTVLCCDVAPNTCARRRPPPLVCAAAGPAASPLPPRAESCAHQRFVLLRNATGQLANLEAIITNLPHRRDLGCGAG